MLLNFISETIISYNCYFLIKENIMVIGCDIIIFLKKFSFITVQISLKVAVLISPLSILWLYINLIKKYKNQYAEIKNENHEFKF